MDKGWRFFQATVFDDKQVEWNNRIRFENRNFFFSPYLFSKGMEGKFERIGICRERWLTLVQFAFSE